MFAVLIINITQNAGRRLAFQCAGVFYVRIHIGTTLYRYPCTPVYRLNGRTAFCGNVMSNGTGTDTFFIYYVIHYHRFQRCNAQQPRNVRPRNGHRILIPSYRKSLHRLRTPGHGPAGLPRPLPPHAQRAGAHPYRHVQHLRHGLHHGSRLVCAAGGARARQMAGEAGVPPPLPCREADAQHPRLHRPASRRYRIAGLPLVSRNLLNLSCSRQFPHRSRPGRVHPEPNEINNTEKT